VPIVGTQPFTDVPTSVHEDRTGWQLSGYRAIDVARHVVGISHTSPMPSASQSLGRLLIVSQLSLQSAMPSLSVRHRVRNRTDPARSCESSGRGRCSPRAVEVGVGVDRTATALTGRDLVGSSGQPSLQSACVEVVSVSTAPQPH